jgi:hypothetical protein
MKAGSLGNPPFSFLTVFVADDQSFRVLGQKLSCPASHSSDPREAFPNRFKTFGDLPI